jgi:putative N6-adenine-specific DNA methylase
LEYRAVATCGFGLEAALRFELGRLGAKDIAASDGRVSFRASGADIARANLWLRTAERVLIVLAEYRAATFDELFEGTRNAPLGEVVGKNDAFPVKGYSINSALTSIPACQAVIKKAAAERLKEQHGVLSLPEEGGVTKRIRFSIVRDSCTLMLDTSGDGLHKRGYRPLLNEAPIKETLAAGIVDLARISAGGRAADPFCGSGTLVIEAAMRARNIAPGLKRRFAGEDYGFLGGGAFAAAREEAAGAVKKDADFSARGLDIDPRAVELAEANAKRAGVEGCLSFAQGDARRFEAAEDETVLANPPYGERMLSEAEAERLYRNFGENMAARRYRGLYVISNSQEFERAFGRQAARRRKLYNGMMPCWLYMYF